MNSRQQVPGNRKERRTHKALIRRAMKKAGVKYEVKPNFVAQPVSGESSVSLDSEKVADAE